MASRRVDAGRRAEQRDRLSRPDTRGKAVDPEALAFHLVAEAPLVVRPRQRAAIGRVLSVGRSVKLGARRERDAPRVPGLGLAAHTAGPIAADEQAIAVLGIARIVPALRPDRHVET